MTKRDDFTDMLVKQAQDMSNAEALRHGRASAKLWRFVDKTIEYLNLARRDPADGALWVLGAAVSRLVILKVNPDEIVDLVHANIAASAAQVERAQSAALEVATRGQTEN